LLSLTRKDKDIGFFYFFLFMVKEELNFASVCGQTAEENIPF